MTFYVEAYSKADSAEKALRHVGDFDTLEAAIAAGYPPQDARDDDELASLRKLPAFAALVADRSRPRQ